MKTSPKSSITPNENLLKYTIMFTLVYCSKLYFTTENFITWKASATGNFNLQQNNFMIT